MVVMHSVWWNIRPRFVYVYVRFKKFPIPLGVALPLVLVEWAVGLALKAYDKKLSNQTLGLRQMPPATLIEISHSKEIVDLKVGLW
jgi:hypothetical protein